MNIKTLCICALAASSLHCMAADPALKSDRSAKKSKTTKVEKTAESNAPRYIFLFVGDGMGLGHVAAAETYARTIRGNVDQLTMLNFPVASLCKTYSASSRVTDSAAAGTALSTGHKITNSMLGMAPDTTDLTSIAVTLKEHGYGIGIITTDSPDDATPGAFYAHAKNRGDYYKIDCDLAASGYDFIAGANLRGTIDKKTKQPTDAVDRIRRAGFDVVRGAEAARSSKSDKVLMLNNDSLGLHGFCYTIDSIPGIVPIWQTTEVAIEHLERTAPDRFFMMVEVGNIDHAAHGNDGGSVIKEIISLNQAIDVAYAFYQKHPDETLIVVTADHDTGGLISGDYRTASKTSLGYIDYQRISKETFTDWCSSQIKAGVEMTWPQMQQFLTDNLGFWREVPVSAKQESKMKQAFDQVFVTKTDKEQESWYHNFNGFAVAVYDVLSENIGMYWTSNTHTGNFTPVYAVGVGAEQFSKLNNNVEIPQKIMKLVGIEREY